MPNELDLSQKPIVVLTATGENGPEEVSERLSMLESLLGSEPPVILIVDTTGTNAPSVQLRAMWTRWLSEHSKEIRESCGGCVMVLKSPLMRGALTAIRWVWTSPVPIHSCASLEEAWDVARSLLSK